jgi:hypothetical protein
VVVDYFMELYYCKVYVNRNPRLKGCHLNVGPIILFQICYVYFTEIRKNMIQWQFNISLIIILSLVFLFKELNIKLQETIIFSTALRL